jgi:hypothetical protein
MSALPPKADIPQRRFDVRFVPKADVSLLLLPAEPDRIHPFDAVAHLPGLSTALIENRLLDYLVGKHEKVVRDVDAEQLGGLEIDDKLEFGRLHDWQVGRLRPL